MKHFRLRLLSLGLLLFLCMPVGQAAQAPSRLLPQVVDAPHVFESPLPPSRPVSASWFSDAVFIGDSRLEGLTSAKLFYPALTLSQIGLNVRDARSSAVFVRDGKRATLQEVLEDVSYNKIYLMLGFNETSWMSDKEFYREYSALIDHLRELSPQAQIYIQTLLPVTVSRAAATGTDNSLLANRNRLLTELAREKQVFLVSVGEYFSEPDGTLSTNFSSDGFHLTTSGYTRWFQYLRTHAMAN